MSQAHALPSVFARRQLPLALGVALTVALIPPAVYREAARHELVAQAELAAGTVAAGVARGALQQPYLWRYDLEKVLQAALPSSALQRVAWLRITDCAGKSLHGPVTMPASIRGPTAWREIRPGGQPVGYVEVSLDGRVEAQSALRLAVACGLLGALLGAGVFLFPRAVVRRQARALGAAEADLVETNQSLRARVEAAVAQVRELSTRMVRIQETERGRIARDLHDGVGQSLAAVRLDLDLARAAGPQASARLEAAASAADEALRELKRAVHDLRPPELARGHLAETLRACAERFELRSGVTASFRGSGPELTTPEITTCLLRVLQEALTNVSRHAQAREVGIRLTVTADLVRLEIEDDGRGFRPQDLPGEGTGLLGIRERCAFHGGDASVRSSPGEGTTISAWLPR